MLVTCLGSRVPRSDEELFMEETGSKEKGGFAHCPPSSDAGQVTDQVAFCFEILPICEFCSDPGKFYPSTTIIP